MLREIRDSIQTETTIRDRIPEIAIEEIKIVNPLDEFQ